MIIIANTLAPNGGTTFLIRIAKQYFLSNNKLKVIVLYNNYSSEHLKDLKMFADVIFVKEFGSFIFSFFSKSQLIPFIIDLKKCKLKEFFKSEKTIHVMGIFGYVLAKRIQVIIPNIKITIGVYHQNEFMYNSYPCYFNSWIQNEIKQTNYNCFIFFNKNTRLSYSKQFKVEFLNSPLLPIGIPEKIDVFNQKKYKPRLIISVGNLVGFKTYNKHIIELLPKLLKKFPDIQYDIYGHGEEFNNLNQLINSLNLNNYVSLKGILDYNKFDEVVSQANVFIGNGTSVLEAANLGVPSISGIESYELPESYGFVSDIEDFDYNEFIPGKVTIEFESLIIKLFKGGEIERQKIGELCKLGVKKFSISNTISGFNKTNEIVNIESTNFITRIVLLRLFFSFFFLGILDILNIDRRFKFRRNQGN